jgi:signal transduction histidine kinase
VPDAAFASAQVASIIVDPSGQILFCNQRASRLFGPDVADGADQLCGKNLARITGMTEADMAAALREGAIKGTANINYRGGCNLRGGLRSAFRVSELSAVNGPSCLYLLTLDLPVATAGALPELRQKVIAMEAFAHSASHDLRTPLNSLSGFVHLLKLKHGETLPDKAMEYLDYMACAITQLDEITAGYLEQVHCVSGALRTEPVDLRASLHRLVDEMKADIVAARGTVEVKGASWAVDADPTLLRMLLENLFRNALKFRHDERLPVISFRLDTRPDHHILTVRDNGRGFAPARNMSIFSRIRSLDVDQEACGIGLVACKQVCRRHGWSISAHSDGHSGAQFTVIFPYRAPAAT